MGQNPIFVRPAGLAVVPGKFVCWACGWIWPPQQKDLIPDPARATFCRNWCRIVYVRARLDETGFEICPSCHRSNGHQTNCYIVIAEQTDWRCGLCFGEIDFSLRQPDPGSATLDHVIPASKGGPRTTANLRLAHYGCNGARANLNDDEWFNLVGIEIPAEAA
jgi:hypothetical protein